ncbi:Hypothetical protein A7982_08329 [Minicystis rosea]|nr:Hypothetical protein A7982_08329 [Minicystis rosea]
MLTRTVASLMGALLGIAALAACGSDGAATGGGGTASTSSGGAPSTSSSGGAPTTSSTGGGTPSAQDVEISFEAHVGDKTFSCADTYDGLGTAGTQVKLTDFRFYVHDVRLLKAGGGEEQVTLKQDGVWQHEDLVLLDFEDKSGACANGTAEVNHRIVGTVPAGAYEGVAFKIGVPEALNHADAATAPSPLNLSGLFWSWQGGYKFLRIDGVPTGATPFNMHLGSTGCTGEPSMGDAVICTHPNVAEVVLSGFDAGKNAIVFDYAALVGDSDLSVNGGGAPGCMSGDTDPECGPVFTRLGLDLATGMPAGNQAVFTVK